MNTHARTVRLIALSVAFLGGGGLVIAQSANRGAEYTITGSTFASGGGMSSGGDFSVLGTTGQPSAGDDLAGGDFSVSGGFWEPVVAMDDDPICPGDCDNSGAVNFSDLVSMLFEFGTPGTNPGCDADDSGTVNFSDLVAALFAFGPCA